ncbi:MAG: hypothetical protein C4542_00235 [Dehalococcoidia bacterium]|nr:MAG: hypothetical protein C4542_00235 [Dehalococcoidia bacterium]
MPIESPLILLRQAQDRLFSKGGENVDDGRYHPPSQPGRIAKLSPSLLSLPSRERRMNEIATLASFARNDKGGFTPPSPLKGKEKIKKSPDKIGAFL